MWRVSWAECNTLCKRRSEWRTNFPEWCFRCWLEEGRADRQSSLSVINKPQRWSGEMPLFDKQEGHCLRISTQVVKWPERGDVRRVTDPLAWMEDVLWSRDPRWVLQSESQECSLVRFVMNGAKRNHPKYLFLAECFAFQDFLWRWSHVDTDPHKGDSHSQD